MFSLFCSWLLIDCRSIGCILYDLVALEHPFQGKTLMGVMYKITEEDPPPWPPSYSAELNELFHQLVFRSCFIQISFSEKLVVTYAIDASPF